MSKFTIYHNPRCSKSRQTLAILEERGITPDIRLYLEDVPDETELHELISKLGINPRDLLRKGEEAYKRLGLAATDKDDAQIIAAMLSEPKLIERPIVVKGSKAVLGRPPENVLELVQG